MRLQTADGVVDSIREVRWIFPEMDDNQFAEWYSKRFLVTEKRVRAILAALREELTC